MRRSVLGWIAVGLVVGLSGCTMCASPYDDCGPVHEGMCGSGCGAESRAGSVLSGASLAMPESEAVLGEMPVTGDLRSNSIPPARHPTQGAASAEGWKSHKPAIGR